MIYVIMYLSAIIFANLTVAWLGPRVTIVNAFLFIGLDLTARDHLHDQWKNDKLALKMTALIATGSVLTIFLNKDAAQIAVASFVAFSAAAIVDTVVYHALGHWPRWLRINDSNVPSAAVDSIIFPALAFVGFLPLITLGQFAAKVGGGFLWSLVFKWYDGRKPRYTVQNKDILLIEAEKGSRIQLWVSKDNGVVFTAAPDELYVSDRPIYVIIGENVGKTNTNIKIVEWNDLAEEE
jgi:hypothetical protein